MHLRSAIRNVRFRRFLIRFVPQCIIYSVCVNFFLSNVINLVAHFANYETNVLINYRVPNETRYPAFTICGCCLSQTIRNDTASEIFIREYHWLRNWSVFDVFDHHSLTVDHLVKKCNFTRSSRESNTSQLNCDLIRPVVESIAGGRKCYTYLSDLTDRTATVVTGPADIDPTVRGIGLGNTEREVSSISVEIRFSNNSATFMRPATLLSSDIVIAFHSRLVLPSMLEAEYFRLDPQAIYSAQFKRSETYLKPKPYRTACIPYRKSQSMI